MGVFKKYRDREGKPTGPRFIQHPRERDPSTGRIKYKTIRASWKKKKAQEMLRKKQDEFYEKMRFGIVADPKMTFGQLLSWGLQQEVMQAKASALDDVSRARYLKAHFESCRAAQITPLMVDNFRVKMKRTVSEKTGAPFSGTTVNKMVSLARRVYYLGMDAGIVTTNPFARRGTFKEPPKGRYISDEHFRSMYEFLPSYMRAPVLTAYMTGMRRGEILNLTWEQVDISEGLIDLAAGNTKTGEPRRIYYTKVRKLREMFSELAKRGTTEASNVFHWKGKPIQPMQVYRKFVNACARAGVGPYRFHDLRHTFNTNMRRAGVDQVTIMKLTGHKTLSMFIRYSHVGGEEGKAAMESLDNHLAQHGCTSRKRGEPENSSTPYLLPKRKRVSRARLTH